MKFLIKLLVKTALIITAGLLIMVYTEKSFTTHIKSALRAIKNILAKLSRPFGVISGITEKD